MAMHGALIQRTLDKELEPHMFSAPLISLLGAVYELIFGVARPGALAVRRDFGSGAQQPLALGVLADQRGGAVEVCGF